MFSQNSANSHSSIVPKVNTWLESSQKFLQTHFANDDKPTEELDFCLDKKVVETITSKLGYTHEEVVKYVTHDKNSFVGVLYQKLLEDQNERRALNDTKSIGTRSTNMLMT
jgi:hypothetical protein